MSQHLEQVKQLVPLFISSIKTCIIIGLTFKNPDSLKMRIDQNKEYLIKRLATEIKEIIRILQLTTHDEESWMCDDLTIMKQKFVRNNFYTSFYAYFNLSDYNYRIILKLKCVLLMIGLQIRTLYVIV